MYMRKQTLGACYYDARRSSNGMVEGETVKNEKNDHLFYVSSIPMIGNNERDWINSAGT